MTTLVTPKPNTALALSADEYELVRASVTGLLEVVPQFAAVMARHLHEEIPALGGVDDDDAVEATRRSCEANMREMFSMLRAGLPASAHETPADALEYARFMRRRGVGLAAVLRAYEIALVMFQPVVAAEFERHVRERSRVDAILAAVSRFVVAYLERVTGRLAAEYDSPRQKWLPDADDAVWRRPATGNAAEAFVAEHIARPDRADPTAPLSGAYAHAERVLDEFCKVFEEAARDNRMSESLALADTTVRITLADEDTLGITLLLDRTPVELDGDADGEVQIAISSADLERVWSEDFNLAMAIARGRVRARGPVRQFLRVESRAKTPEQPVVRGRDHQLAATCCEHLVRRDQREGGAVARG